MRKHGFRSPIIMLTGQDSDSDTVLGLEAGANDYVAKPFKFAVLLARVRAQLRQYAASEDAVFQIGPYNFKPGSKLLVGENGSKLKLTEKETAILRFLYRAGQQVVSRDTLLAEVWGYNANVTTHTLETHIYRLRQKIEPNPSDVSLLVTEGGGLQARPLTIAGRGPCRSTTTSRCSRRPRFWVFSNETPCGCLLSRLTNAACVKAMCCSARATAPMPVMS